MPSRREEVLDAIKAMIAGALPNAEVKRNLDKPERIPPGGLVIIRDGDPGEPEVLLSPLTYVYEHRVPIELAAFASASLTREQTVDQMLSAIGTAAELAVRPVSVPVAGVLSDAVRAGAQVDLWFTAAVERSAGAGTAAPVPVQLASGLTVADVSRPAGAFAAGGTTTVHVLVAVSDLPKVLAAIASQGVVDVVAVPGTGG